MSDKDWRDSAYLKKENWPDAIPNCGPKREYGPYPWGSIFHHDPHNLDEYPAAHPHAADVGYEYPGDVCPSCGVPLSNEETVVNRSGEEDIIWNLARDDVREPLYHRDCLNERKAAIARIENKALEDYL